jgi:hypothetical protein
MLFINLDKENLCLEYLCSVGDKWDLYTYNDGSSKNFKGQRFVFKGEIRRVEMHEHYLAHLKLYLATEEWPPPSTPYPILYPYDANFDRQRNLFLTIDKRWRSLI